MPSILDDILNDSLDEDYVRLLQSGIMTRHVPRGTILLRKGDPVAKTYYVKSGCLRSYSIDGKGKEHIFMFAPEGWVISDIEASVKGNPAALYIDAIEDAEVEVCDSRMFTDTLPSNHQAVTRLFRRISVLQKRIIMLMSASLQERYLDFVETYPNIAQRVPQKMIASYLGVTPEALSKVRGDLSKRMFEQVRAISDIAKITYTRQKRALGLGHAIYQAKDFVGSEPFAVLLADDVVDSEQPALKQLIDVYERYNAPVIATMQITDETISRFGVIDADEVEPGVFKLKSIVEKPKFEDAPSDMAVVGRYIFTPELFEAIEQIVPGAGGEYQVADAMRILLNKGFPFYAVKLEGTRHDAGDKLGFLIATVEFAMKRADLGEDFKRYLRSLKLDS